MEQWFWGGVALFSVLTAFSVFVVLRIRRRATATGSSSSSGGPVRSVDNDEPKELIIPLPDGRQALVIRPLETTRDVGASVRSDLPAEVLRRAAQFAPQGLEASLKAGQASGRIMVVDAATATALRSSGARDSVGRLLPMVRDSSGRFVRIARLRDVANVSTLTSVGAMASAMATQAQLARIEAAIEAVSAKIDAVGELMEIDREAARLAVADILRSVYRDAQETGTLTDGNWRQIESQASQVRAHFHADRMRLERAVTHLRSLADQGAKKQSKEIENAVIDLTRAQVSYRDSAHAWVQYSMLKLWRMQVVDDPTLTAATAATQAEMLDWAQDSQLRDLANSAIETMRAIKWHARILHVPSVIRLPKRLDAAAQQVDALPWEVLSGADDRE